MKLFFIDYSYNQYINNFILRHIVMKQYIILVHKNIFLNFFNLLFSDFIFEHS